VPRTAPSLVLIVITVMLGTFMGVMDAAIVNVAIPAISGNLGATTDEAAWVATGYTLGMMIVMPLNGWLTQRLGQKWYYLAAFGLFTVMNVLCGLAVGIWQLVVFRVLQGLGGGALQPIALAILLKTAPPARRGDMIGLFSLASLVPFALGPVIGGYILDNYDWRLLFFFKLPICAIGVALAYFAIPDDEAPGHGRPVSWSGLALMSIALASLQLVLSRGQQEDWFDSQQIVVLTIVAALAFVWFAWAQLRAAHPLVNLRIFRTTSFAIGCFVSVISGFGLYAINLVTPLFFQGPLRLSAYDTGIFLLQGSVATAAVIPFIGPLTRRFDARALIAVGLLVFALGAWMMGDLNADAGYWDVFWPRVLQGAALGLLFVPLMTVTLSQIDARVLSDATGIATLVRYLGGNIGIAVLQFVQVRRAIGVVGALAGGTTLAQPAVAAFVHHVGLVPAQLFLSSSAAANANVVSYLFLFRIAAIIFALTVPLTALLPDTRRVPH
jgi:DHA2 family multidrug resistance protein